MLLEFPDDPTSPYLERQFMLGPDLLVAPVMSADGTVTYYVPEGTWTSLLTGQRMTGPRWVTERHGFDSLPLLVREGAVLPLGSVDDRPDYEWAEGLRVRVYTPDVARARTVAVPDGRGGTVARIEVVVADGSATARLLSGAATYQVQLVPWAGTPGALTACRPAG
jgi:alpha-D-xyloside xylohydrolase